jgi:cyanophycinase
MGSARQARGAVLIVGGAESKTGDCEILRELIRLAGGSKARMLVLPMASDYPLDVGERYARLFREFGARSARALHIETRAQADEPSTVRLLDRATGVFFAGGDQQRILDRVVGSAFELALHRRHGDGLVVGGTSAGAAAMSSIMIVSGRGLTGPRLGGPAQGPGLSILRGAIIDQHFSERGRFGRLLAALAEHPGHLGLGIDEDTALLFDEDELTVLGRGQVTVIDAGGLSYNNASDLTEPGTPLALCDLTLHVLPAGHRFDLRTRRPLVDGEVRRTSELALVSA